MATWFPFGVNENILEYTQHVGILLDGPKSSFECLYDVMEKSEETFLTTQ